MRPWMRYLFLGLLCLSFLSTACVFAAAVLHVRELTLLAAWAAWVEGVGFGGFIALCLVGLIVPHLKRVREQAHEEGEVRTVWSWQRRFYLIITGLTLVSTVWVIHLAMLYVIVTLNTSRLGVFDYFSLLLAATFCGGWVLLSCGWVFWTISRAKGETP